MILEADNLTHQNELLEVCGAKLIVPKHIRTLGERTDFGEGLLETLGAICASAFRRVVWRDDPPVGLIHRTYPQVSGLCEMLFRLFAVSSHMWNGIYVSLASGNVCR